MKHRSIAYIVESLAITLKEAKHKKRKKRKEKGIRRVPSSMLYYMDYTASGSSDSDGDGGDGGGGEG